MLDSPVKEILDSKIASRAGPVFYSEQFIEEIRDPGKKASRFDIPEKTG
jgi:hypothetical protein